MKLFIATHITPKKLIIVTEIAFLSPLAYAAPHGVPSTTNTSTPLTAISLIGEEGGQNFRFSTSSYTKMQEFIPDVVFLPVEKVKKGVVQSFDRTKKSIIIKAGDKLISVQNTASTTFYFGGGSVTDEYSVDNNMKIYVFGYANSDNTMISALKIVIANKSRFLGF